MRSILAQSWPGAAGAGVNGDDRVLAIVLAAEHLLDLAGLHLPVEQVEACANSASTARRFHH
jgi:hypothetical protein